MYHTSKYSGFETEPVIFDYIIVAKLGLKHTYVYLQCYLLGLRISCFPCSCNEEKTRRKCFTRVRFELLSYFY